MHRRSFFGGLLGLFGLPLAARPAPAQPLPAPPRELWDIVSRLPNIDPDAHLDMERPDILAVFTAYGLGYWTLPTDQNHPRVVRKNRTLADVLLTLPGIESGGPLPVERVDVKAVLDAYQFGYEELLRHLRSGEALAVTAPCRGEVGHA